jgi:hypothetical protein
MTTYRHLLLHPGLLAPMRQALLARISRATPRSRLEVWENEGGALKFRITTYGEIK